MFDRRFTIRTSDRPDVLGRIVALCQQRRCQIVTLSFVGGDDHREGQLLITVRASTWHGDRLAAWLSSLVDVVDVRESRG
jgi:acetolactate synthase small subunit